MRSPRGPLSNLGRPRRSARSRGINVGLRAQARCRGYKSVNVVPRGGSDDVDVRAHKLARRLRVAPQHRADDGVVLRVRFGQAVGDGELGAPKRCNALANANSCSRQELVVCATINRIVKLEIEGPVAIPVVVAHGLERAPVNELEPDPFRVRHALRRQPHA
jgi:hypothetical protein